MERCRIGNLPEELVHEILLRLPVKDLIVCKCVWKVWCALIKSPSFVNRHYNHESNQECLVFFGKHISPELDDKNQYAYSMYDDERHSLVEAPNHLRQMPCRMITEGPEKGIFCLRLSFCLGLLNPATREFKTLPPIPPLHGQRAEVGAQPWIGCGLDPSSGDFKVIAFEKTDKCNYACVYNLRSDSWKKIETINPYDKIHYSRCIGIPILNGVKNWLIKSANDRAYSILAFDMRSEKFQEIAIPVAIRKREESVQITLYCDSLAVISYKFNQRIDMWVMRRDGLWSKSFSIGPFPEIVWPLHVWKKNKVLFQSSSLNLVMCDVSTNKVTALNALDVGIVPKYSLGGCFTYKESLLSIKGTRADSLEDIIRLCVIRLSNS